MSDRRVQALLGFLVLMGVTLTVWAGGPDLSWPARRWRAKIDEEAPMTRDELLARISIDPNVCFGKPCIRGHRIWVSLILDLLADGASIDQLMADYPGITADDIRGCIAYGAEMARERYVDIPIHRAS